MAGINFRMKNDKSLGPGSYATPDEVEKMKRKREKASISPGKAVAFGAGQNRDKNNFQNQFMREHAY